MLEDDNSSNIEWEQDKGISKNTRVSRRFDLKKAIKSEATERNNFKTNPSKPSLAPNLKRLQSKIRDAYDDEDDEDEVVYHFSFNDDNSSLINALKDDEKQQFSAKKIQEDQKMQQTAGKMETILQADKVARQLGLKGLKKKVVINNIQDISINTQTKDQVLLENVAAKTKIKTSDLSSRETTDMVKGLRKMRIATMSSENIRASTIENMKAEELIEIGRSNDEKKTAKMILEKSGRKEAKKADETQREKEQQKIKSAIKRAKSR